MKNKKSSTSKRMRLKTASVSSSEKRISDKTQSNIVLQNPTQATIVTQQVSQVMADNKVTRQDDLCDNLDVSKMSPEDKEGMIVETLERLKILIDEKTPFTLLNYKAEFDRVQEERKMLQIASATGGGPQIERRLPKRRFPWCDQSRRLLSRLVQLAGHKASVNELLTKRVIPLFPHGFARIPTLLKQANLKNDIESQVKPNNLKRQHSTTAPMKVPSLQPSNDSLTAPATIENIYFPSSLTVTTIQPQETTNKSTEGDAKKAKLHKSHSKPSDSKHDPQYPINTFKLNKDITVVCTTENKQRHSKEKSHKISSDNEIYIGNTTITAVPMNRGNNKQMSDDKVIATESKQTEPTIRVKSQATLMKEADELAKRDKDKSKEIST